MALTVEQKYLPSEILDKSIVSGKEYGWKRTDFREVVDKAVEVGLGIIGGQVQFKLQDGTCELYWHKYDTKDRKLGESWTSYCERTKQECITLFNKLPENKELVIEGIDNFNFLKEKQSKGINIEKNLIFIIYFDGTETKE